MAIIDVFQRVSENQALTGGGLAGNFFSKSIDLTPSAVAARFRDVGRGNEIALRVQVTETFTSGGGGATALDITIVTADVDDTGFFATNLVNLAKWSNVKAVLTLGAVFTLPVPTIPRHMLDALPGSPGRRFLGVVYTGTGGDLTFDTGKVTAEFGHWRDATIPSIHGIAYKGP